MAKKVAPKGAKSSPIGKLQIHTEEDRKPEDQRDGIKYGVTTGLNLTHFLNELFLQNYDAQLSDPELLAICEKEYPGREGKFQSMSAYRGYFNSNKHGHGTGEVLEGENRLTRFHSQEELEERAEKREAAKADKKAAEKVTSAPGKKVVTKKVVKK